jgi:hypothetical protein
MDTLSGKIERNLGWLVVLLLLGGCLLVLRPFISPLLWAVVLCISSWPVYQRLLGWVGNRRTLAAALMTLAMIFIFLLPFFIVVMTLADNIKELTGALRSWIQAGPPAPPEWLPKIPVVGQKAMDYWQSMAADTAKLWTEAQRLVEPASSWLLKGGSNWPSVFSSRSSFSAMALRLPGVSPTWSNASAANAAGICSPWRARQLSAWCMAFWERRWCRRSWRGSAFSSPVCRASRCWRC